MESGNSGGSAYSFDPHGSAAHAAPAAADFDGDASRGSSSPDFVVIRSSSARVGRGRGVYPEPYSNSRRSQTPRHDNNEAATRRRIREETDRNPPSVYQLKRRFEKLQSREGFQQDRSDLRAAHAFEQSASKSVCRGKLSISNLQKRLDAMMSSSSTGRGVPASEMPFVGPDPGSDADRGVYPAVGTQGASHPHGVAGGHDGSGVSPAPMVSSGVSPALDTVSGVSPAFGLASSNASPGSSRDHSHVVNQQSDYIHGDLSSSANVSHRTIPLTPTSAAGGVSPAGGNSVVEDAGFVRASTAETPPGARSPSSVTSHSSIPISMLLERERNESLRRIGIFSQTLVANNVAARVEVENERNMREEAERREAAARATAENEHYWRTTSQNQVNETIRIANIHSSKVAHLEQEVADRDEAMARSVALMRNESQEIGGLKNQLSQIRLDLDAKSNTFAAAASRYQADAHDSEQRFKASEFNAEVRAQESVDRIDSLMAKQKSDSDRVVLQMKEQYEAMLVQGKALNARFHVSHEEHAALRNECMEIKSAKSKLKSEST